MEQCTEADAIGWEGWGDDTFDDEYDDYLLSPRARKVNDFLIAKRREDAQKNAQKYSFAGHPDQVETIDARNKYSLAKSAKVGDNICCAGCGKMFIKTTYNKTFCSNGRTTKGKSSCKDRYHNMVTPSRLDRLNLN